MVSELFEPSDLWDRRLSASAQGLLAEFNRAGVLEAADIQVGRRVSELAAGTVAATTVDMVGLTEGRQFGYWFDFGDDWHHQIGVEKIEDGPGEGTYPRVVKRVGASPPQYADDDEEG